MISKQTMETVAELIVDQDPKFLLNLLDNVRLSPYDEDFIEKGTRYRDARQELEERVELIEPSQVVKDEEDTEDEKSDDVNGTNESDYSGAE